MTNSACKWIACNWLTRTPPLSKRFSNKFLGLLNLAQWFFYIKNVNWRWTCSLLLRILKFSLAVTESKTSQINYACVIWFIYAKQKMDQRCKPFIMKRRCARNSLKIETNSCYSGKLNNDLAFAFDKWKIIWKT